MNLSEFKQSISGDAPPAEIGDKAAAGFVVPPRAASGTARMNWLRRPQASRANGCMLIYTALKVIFQTPAIGTAAPASSSTAASSRRNGTKYPPPYLIRINKPIRRFRFENCAHLAQQEDL